ncbi:GGDEF domain-containing protein [Thermodesulforhabdus norvegica]|uniref:diguanylate cyclase n=1 Tax=Thermodesulforhabdus norvegica TaxID=39841 RepID=A0A1I4QKF0_9BACT|nr:GGDEF domain-containing protein [Thermodesulforhabdus norvegica]SFM40093.1 diguanylate cyclase (GGDEF) domain-containing protein [Thermodesulforhabdus norvegica]
MLDPLTGLYNMRSFFRALESEMHRTRRSRVPTSLIMLDLDHFKQINDTYGHIAGDYVLKSVADTLRNGVRAGDLPCRYGGEEFAVVLPGTSLSQAVGVAKRLKEAIEKLKCFYAGKEIPVTASFGVATYRGTTPPEVTPFVDRADKCLMEAKQNGRNRIVWEAEEPKIEVSPQEKELLKIFANS